MAIYPDWYIPCHYAGAELFDVESYEEAYPYLQKSLTLGGSAYGVHRYLETHYRLYGEIPKVGKWPSDLAVEYYNAGVTFFEAELLLANSKSAESFLVTRTKFYEIAYNAFHAYFFDHVGPAQNNDIHIFAMCCNNYGLALSSLNEDEQAEKVHQLGYSISPFWEQLSSWGAVLIELNRYEEGLVKIQQALVDSQGEMEFGNYINLRGSEAKALFALDRVEESKQLLNNTEIEYDNFIIENKNELNESELFVLTERYIGLQNVRSKLLTTATPEDAIKVWQEQLEKNPEDNSNWFMLMQNYYQLNDYKQCIACADNYLMIKGDALLAESAVKVYFMRGISYFKTEKFDKALNDLNLLLEIQENQFAIKEPDLFTVYKHISAIYFQLENWKKCLDFAQNASDIYSNNDWQWDDDLIPVILMYADACKADKNINAAIKTVDGILKNFPDHKEALQRKQEWKSGGFFSMFKRK